jgi:hypothetical protein
VLVLYFCFHAGGYFPGVTGLVATVVLVALLLRVALCNRPFAGLGRASIIGEGALGLFALWTLLSAAWSDAPARALVEYDRVLLYLGAFVLFGALGRGTDRLRWMVRGIAAAAFVVCLCGLATRLLPDVWKLPPAVADERLNYPLTYWNSLGLLAALGMVFCFGISCDERETRIGRAVAAAALPVLATTLLLTFSRGSIATGVIGLVAFVALGRPRTLPSALLAAGPAVAIAVFAGYSADLLASTDPTTGAAAAQGHRVALVVAFAVVIAFGSRWALFKLDGWWSTSHLPALLRRPSVVRDARVALLVVVLYGLFIWPVNIRHQYDSFVNGDQVSSADLRGRLASSGDNGRIEHWRAALVGFHDRPMTGTGAGTFALQWDRVGRGDKLQLQDAHSLYVEVLGELGIIGFLLVVTAVVTVLVGFFARARGDDRVLGALLFGAGLTWALAAGVDWFWETPAVTFWFFAAGGAALATRDASAGGSKSNREAHQFDRRLRPVLGVACLLLALGPALVYLSDGPLRDSVRAFDRGDCNTTIARALDSISALNIRPEPQLLLGYCDVRLGRPALAVRAMKNAVRRDPRDWEVHYGLALVRAADGLDPRPETRLARRLNPRDSMITDTLRLFATNKPQQWRTRARHAALPES